MSIEVESACSPLLKGNSLEREEETEAGLVSHVSVHIMVNIDVIWAHRRIPRLFHR